MSALQTYRGPSNRERHPSNQTTAKNLICECFFDSTSTTTFIDEAELLSPTTYPVQKNRQNITSRKKNRYDKNSTAIQPIASTKQKEKQRQQQQRQKTPPPNAYIYTKYFTAAPKTKITKSQLLPQWGPSTPKATTSPAAPKLHRRRPPPRQPPPQKNP